MSSSAVLSVLDVLHRVVVTGCVATICHVAGTKVNKLFPPPWWTPGQSRVHSDGCPVNPGRPHRSLSWAPPVLSLVLLRVALLVPLLGVKLALLDGPVLLRVANVVLTSLEVLPAVLLAVVVKAPM